jgi:hypothetical protein
MIVLFSDFGLHGPYLGQVKAVLCQLAPQQAVIDLFSDAPVYDVRSSAYLLAAYRCSFPVATVFCAVVDPGVGSDLRQPVFIEAGGQWFVGPDNGLFARVAAADPLARCWRIDWRPEHMSETFHGRDLFAPVAARLACGEQIAATVFPQAVSLNSDWPVDYHAVIYTDHFGNALTGIKASSMADDDQLVLKGTRQGDVHLTYARTYQQVAVGQAFWYRNANDLVEIAINQGHAAQAYGLSAGVPVTLLTG